MAEVPATYNEFAEATGEAFERHDSYDDHNPGAPSAVAAASPARHSRFAHRDCGNRQEKIESHLAASALRVYRA